MSVIRWHRYTRTHGVLEEREDGSASYRISIGIQFDNRPRLTLKPAALDSLLTNFLDSATFIKTAIAAVQSQEAKISIGPSPEEGLTTDNSPADAIHYINSLIESKGQEEAAMILHSAALLAQTEGRKRSGAATRKDDESWETIDKCEDERISMLRRKLAPLSANGLLTRVVGEHQAKSIRKRKSVERYLVWVQKENWNS